MLRAELDAAFFHLYGLPRDDVDYVMDTFPIVRRHDDAAHSEYRTKRLILERYDAMTDAIANGTAYETPLDPPPADPRVAHPPRAAPPVPEPVPDEETEATEATPPEATTTMTQPAAQSPNEPEVDPGVEEDEGEEVVVHPYDPSKNNISTKQLSLDLLIRRLRHGEIAVVRGGTSDPDPSRPHQTTPVDRLRRRPHGDRPVLLTHEALPLRRYPAGGDL